MDAQQVELRKQLAKAQLDQWQGRFDELEVQMHLASKEAGDKANALMEQLRGRWADARRQMEESISTASSVADTVRAGLEKAYTDLRKALLELPPAKDHRQGQAGIRQAHLTSGEIRPLPGPVLVQARAASPAAGR